MKKIKVLIIDDSVITRQVLRAILAETSDIEVVGYASDPILARERIKSLNPDVLTLDVEMPRMDGLTFLRNLMKLRPMPVVMISGMTSKSSEAGLAALSLGAVDIVHKPNGDLANGLQAYADDIASKIRLAANANVTALCDNNQSKTNNILNIKIHYPAFHRSGRIVALGSSTGGTEAIKRVVCRLPNTSPPIVVSQHLPAAYSESFAKHVDAVTAMSVCVARDGQPIDDGCVYIAPGGRHLRIAKQGDRFACRLDDGAPVNLHKPSVDVMFRSVAELAGNKAIGVMLTGMGADGAQAMAYMRDRGAMNIVQDEESSVVWGMPGEAFKLGAAHFVLPLEKIAEKILFLAS